jgi:excisionase family DNA binding protein
MADTMPDMTMRQAAEWAGVTRATIQKAIVSGRLTAPKDDKGQYQINPAELERVYQPKQSDTAKTGSESHAETVDLTAAYNREIALLREMVDKAEARLADLARDRDKWRDQAEAQTRLLTHQGELKPGSRWNWFRKGGS